MHWAFFPFSNHTLSARVTSPAEQFLALQKVYLVQVTFPSNISFSIATWIRTKLPLWFVTNSWQLPTHHRKLSDGRTEKSNRQATSGLVFTFSLWCLSLQCREFVRMLCSCSPAVTKPRLTSAKASVAVNKAVLVNREWCTGLGGKRWKWGTNAWLCWYSRVQRWCPSCWALPDSPQRGRFKTPHQPEFGDSWAAVTFLALRETAQSDPQEQCQGKRCLQTQELQVCHGAGTAGKPGRDAILWQSSATLQ